ncbi:MAG: UDP-N-acetylmuramoyl-L-alanine--D-glutamate ligase [Bdellovibrionales bacterium]
MRKSDLKGKKVVIWGTGREGRAAAEYIRKQQSDQVFTFVDEDPKADMSFLASGDKKAVNSVDIKSALDGADVIIKSPGVSLYHPLLRGKTTTSLLNLWLAEPHEAKIICVTGSKGKSTTSSLLAHTLNALGEKAALLGNIGVPVTEFSAEEKGYAIVEVSSYQAATLSEACDIGVVTSLYPEHLDWHGSLKAYYRDKLNLLTYSGKSIVNAEAAQTAKENGITIDKAILFNTPTGFHIKDGQVFDKETPLRFLKNTYLSRAHNLVNVCAALTVLKELGIAPKNALPKMESFQALPHRQQELGEKDGITFVDDSISTTPQSAIAAMEAYTGRPLTLLAGGFDRGIDYAPLVDYVQKMEINAVVCMGPSGERIYKDLHTPNAFYAPTLQEAVAIALEKTPLGGVILLSPASPSYGMFKNFEERGNVFAELTSMEGTPSCRR